MRVLFSLAFAFALTVPAFAQDVNTQTGEVTFNGPELATLLKAVHDSEKSLDVTINVAAKKTSEMPASDPLVYYAGLDATKPSTAIVWVNTEIKPSAEGSNALQAAMELACMDTGFAGPKWKTVYDFVSAKDAALSGAETNRFQWRHKLTSRIQQIIDSYKSKLQSEP